MADSGSIAGGRRLAHTYRVVLLSALLSGCVAGIAAPSPTPTLAPSASPTPAAKPTSTATSAPTVTPADATAVIARANDVLAALKARDGAKLAAIADPARGVRFTPYPYVRTDQDIVLSAAEIARGFADPVQRVWGTTDGKGDPIRLAFADYVARYVYDRDYLARAQVSVDSRNGDGNTIDNTKTVYPTATLVEFYQPSSPNTLDWRALRLLFEQRSGAWYLVAVVHGEWTI